MTINSLYISAVRNATNSTHVSDPIKFCFVRFSSLSTVSVIHYFFRLTLFLLSLTCRKYHLLLFFSFFFIFCNRVDLRCSSHNWNGFIFNIVLRLIHKRLRLIWWFCHHSTFFSSTEIRKLDWFSIMSVFPKGSKCCWRLLYWRFYSLSIFTITPIVFNSIRSLKIWICFCSWFISWDQYL